MVEIPPVHQISEQRPPATHSLNIVTHLRQNALTDILGVHEPQSEDALGQLLFSIPLLDVCDYVSVAQTDHIGGLERVHRILVRVQVDDVVQRSLLLALRDDYIDVGAARLRHLQEEYLLQVRDREHDDDESGDQEHSGDTNLVGKRFLLLRGPDTPNYRCECIAGGHPFIATRFPRFDPHIVVIAIIVRQTGRVCTPLWLWRLFLHPIFIFSGRLLDEVVVYVG